MSKEKQIKKEKWKDFVILFLIPSFLSVLLPFLFFSLNYVASHDAQQLWDVESIGFYLIMTSYFVLPIQAILSIPLTLIALIYSKKKRSTTFLLVFLAPIISTILMAVLLLFITLFILFFATLLRL